MSGEAGIGAGGPEADGGRGASGPGGEAEAPAGAERPVSMTAVIDFAALPTAGTWSDASSAEAEDPEVEGSRTAKYGEYAGDLKLIAAGRVEGFNELLNLPPLGEEELEERSPAAGRWQTMRATRTAARGVISYGKLHPCLCGLMAKAEHIAQCRSSKGHWALNQTLGLQMERVCSKTKVKREDLAESPYFGPEEEVLLPASILNEWVANADMQHWDKSVQGKVECMVPAMQKEEKRWLEGRPTHLGVYKGLEAAAAGGLRVKYKAVRALDFAPLTDPEWMDLKAARIPFVPGAIAWEPEVVVCLKVLLIQKAQRGKTVDILSREFAWNKYANQSVATVTDGRVHLAYPILQALMVWGWQVQGRRGPPTSAEAMLEVTWPFRRLNGHPDAWRTKVHRETVKRWWMSHQTGWAVQEMGAGRMTVEAAKPYLYRAPGAVVGGAAVKLCGMETTCTYEIPRTSPSTKGKGGKDEGEEGLEVEEEADVDPPEEEELDGKPPAVETGDEEEEETETREEARRSRGSSGGKRGRDMPTKTVARKKPRSAMKTVTRSVKAAAEAAKKPPPGTGKKGATGAGKKGGGRKGASRTASRARVVMEDEDTDGSHAERSNS